MPASGRAGCSMGARSKSGLRLAFVIRLRVNDGRGVSSMNFFFQSFFFDLEGKTVGLLSGWYQASEVRNKVHKNW